MAFRGERADGDRRLDSPVVAPGASLQVSGYSKSVHTVATAPSPLSSRRSALRLALVVAVAHGVNDAYMSFIPPLLPRLMDDLGLSIALATGLAVAFSVASSLPQPLFGYLADRHGRRLFTILGPVVAAVFVSTIGWANSFPLLVLFLVLGGLGSAAFHPPGASYAVRIDAGQGGGARYSIFAFGGSIGFAIGPLMAVGLVQARGLEGAWVAMLPAIVFAPLVFLQLPPDGRRAREGTPPPTPGLVLRALKGPLGLVFGISAIMAFVQRTFVTMEPIIVAEAGGSEALGALALSVYLGAQSFGMVASGLLTDRVSRRKLLAHLCFWAVPAHLLAVWLGPSGAIGWCALAAAGFLGMATLPPIVVLAQEMLPSGTGVGSGIVMGLAWATGTVFVLGTGVVADGIGAATATMLSVPVGVLAVGLALHPALREVLEGPTATERTAGVS